MVSDPQVKKSISSGGQADPYQPLRAIMDMYGVKCSPKDFYWAVNEAYHTAESGIYDQVHSDMHAELIPVWERLLRHLPTTGHGLRVLDIGAGTGFVGALLNLMVPTRVESLTLLDPNPGMLDLARKKSKSWDFPSYFLTGEISLLERNTSPYHVITANSVLHHIVELERFCRIVAAVLPVHGLFLHAHDPRSRFDADTIYAERKNTRRGKRRAGIGKHLRDICGQFARAVLRRPVNSPLAKATSQILLEKGFIERQMEMTSIWAVTDFHVPGQQGNFGGGLVVPQLHEWLDGLSLSDFFTYHFHGTPWHDLSENEKRRERSLLEFNDLHGELCGCAWLKTR